MTAQLDIHDSTSYFIVHYNQETDKDNVEMHK